MGTAIAGGVYTIDLDNNEGSQPEGIHDRARHL